MVYTGTLGGVPTDAAMKGPDPLGRGFVVGCWAAEPSPAACKSWQPVVGLAMVRKPDAKQAPKSLRVWSPHANIATAAIDRAVIVTP